MKLIQNFPILSQTIREGTTHRALTTLEWGTGAAPERPIPLRLARATEPLTTRLTTASYVHNSNNLRMEKLVNGVSTQYLWDSAEILKWRTSG